MDHVTRIGRDRLALVAAPAGPATAATCTAGLVELSRAGLRVSNPGAMTDLVDVAGTCAHERHRRGQRGRYAPLFDGFPDNLPAFDDVYLRALLGASRLAGTDVDAVDEQTLRDAYDFTGIGWWPASSLPQDVPATLAARARQETLPADGHTQWATITLVDPAELTDQVRAWMADAFATPTSLRADVREDLAAAVAALGTDHIDPATVTFRETRTLLTRLVWDTDPDRLPRLGLTPDDLLRLMADLTGSDVSLGTPITYPRLTRAQRRLVIATLEASDRLSDVFRRRGLWLALGKGLHVGTHAGAPRTREVFERLRTTRHDHTSLPAQFEAALAVDLPAAVKLAADQAPGVLGRQLRRLAHLAVATDPACVDALCEALAGACDRITVPVLLAARAQVADNGATYPRVAFTRAGGALIIDRPTGHLALPADVRDRLLAVLDTGIGAHLAAKGTWEDQRIHLADGMDQVLIPLALRTTAPGLAQVERGSALPAGDAPVVRLFVHWKHPHSDLDLSCLALGADFEVVDQVSWTHLRSGAMVHSGDITSAPEGAQEFIDVDLAAARQAGAGAGWRYLAPAIFTYSGPAFADLEEAVAGWMLRQSPTRDRAVFDPATVAGAFELTGRARTVVPFVLDLVTGQIIYTDLYLRGHATARVERDGASIGRLARALVARRAQRPNVAALVAAHLAARGGTLVTDPAQATITIGTEPTCTYDVLRPERLLADLL